MGRNYKIVTPYSPTYSSERVFFVHILLDGIPLPPAEIHQLRKLEIDTHESKATVGTLEMLSTNIVDDDFAKSVRNNRIWRAGRKLTIFAGPIHDVVVFKDLYLRTPLYKFTDDGVIIEIKFKDKTTRMRRRQRRRRFKNMSAKKLLQKMAEKYDLILNAPDDLEKIVFDDNLSFSQVNQTDASLLDKLGRTLGYQWRIENDQLIFYHPDDDVNQHPKYYYRLEYNTGECSILRFSPKLKVVRLNQTVTKLTRKNYTASIKSGQGKNYTANPTKSKETELIKKNTSELPILAQREVDKMTAKYKRSLSWIYTVPDYSGTRLSTIHIDSDYIPGMYDQEKKILNFRNTSEYIIAEAILAIPTLRIQPRTWTYITIAGSEFFSGLYRTKRTRFKIDMGGNIEVSILFKRRAWQNIVKLQPRKEDPSINYQLEDGSTTQLRELGYEGKTWRFNRGTDSTEKSSREAQNDLIPDKDEGSAKSGGS